MSALFWATYAASWMLIAALLAAVFLLYRHHGVKLLGGSASRLTQGTPLGRAVPPLSMSTLSGEIVVLGKPSASGAVRQIVAWLAVTCQPCRKLLPALARLAEAQSGESELLIVCSGHATDVAAFARELPSHLAVVPDERRVVTRDYQVFATPYLFVIGTDGVLLSKGIVTEEAALARLVEEGQSRDVASRSRLHSVGLKSATTANGTDARESAASLAR